MMTVSFCRYRSGGKAVWGGLTGCCKATGREMMAGAYGQKGGNQATYRVVALSGWRQAVRVTSRFLFLLSGSGQCHHSKENR